MVRRSSPLSKGLSLVEVLIASFLLIIVGLVTWSFLKGSIQLSQRGHLRVKTQENVRSAMNQIQGELRQAARPPRVGNNPQYTSGVLYPCTTDASSQSDTDSKNGHQRVIFLEITGLGDTYQRDLNNFKIVEYAAVTQDGRYEVNGGASIPAHVPYRDDNNLRKIVRTTWDAYDTTYNTCIKGLTCDTSGNYTFTPSALPAPLPAQRNDLLTLPNSEDKVSMEIYHPPTATPGRYEDRLFKIRLNVEQTLNNLENKREVFSIENQVNIK